MLAGYRIERKLGEGGMGAVYLAANPDLPRHDAVKVLSAELSRNPDFRARFIREADVAARLNHPNIVAVYRRGETPNGQLWIAMQYVDGSDADAALRAGTMTPQRAIHIVNHIGSALDYAHGNHVVHRDIKPANFLLLRDGDEERSLLADFGIARALDEIGLTASGAVMSTVAYAAPEVFAGAPVDYRADLYSLGCTLFKLLTGKTPFHRAVGAPAVMLAHLQQPPPRVTELVPSLPAALDEVIAVAMNKDPARRYPSAGELAAAATVALQGQSPTVRWRAHPGADFRSATSAAPGPGVGRRKRRPGTVAAVLAVAVTTVAALAAVIAGRSHPGAGPPTAAPTPVPPVAIRDLHGLLPGVEQLDATLNASVTVKTDTTGIGLDSNSLDSQDCAGPWMAAQRASYFGSGWQALQLQGAERPNRPAVPNELPPPMLYSFVAVVSFPVAQLASRYLDSQQPVWQRCVDRTVTFRGPGSFRMPLRFSEFSIVDDGIFSIGYHETDATFDCGRALTVRNNVAIDIAVCNSAKPTDDAVSLAQQIAGKVRH